VVQGRDAVDQDPAADQEHGGGARDREQAHQERSGAEDPGPQSAPQTGEAGLAALPVQVEAQIVELDDGGHDSVHADRHQDRDAGQHDETLHERCGGHGAERDHDDLGGQDEVGADRPLDLVPLQLEKVDAG